MTWADRFGERRPIGMIDWDESSKGNGSRHGCWRAELKHGKVRIRHRSKNYSECEVFLLNYIEQHEGELPKRAVQNLRNSFYEQDL